MSRWDWTAPDPAQPSRLVSELRKAAETDEGLQPRTRAMIFAAADILDGGVKLGRALARFEEAQRERAKGNDR